MVSKIYKIFIYLIVLMFSVFCLLPFILVLSGSLTPEKDIIKYGYSLIPGRIDFTSYKILFMDSSKLINGYKVSIVVTVLGTFISLVVNSLLAYPISLKRLRYRKWINIYVLITILFNGGMVPWYIVCVRYLGLTDSYRALIIPYLANAWNVFLLRNYFQTVPDEMAESAKIDGAGEYRIFFRIIIPLSKPVLATVGLFISLMYWNDWWLGIMLINKAELQPLQLLLRTITANVQFLNSSGAASKMSQLVSILPAEGIKMATCILTIGPIVFIYPFIQKYFIKGIMIGAIKG